MLPVTRGSTHGTFSADEGRHPRDLEKMFQESVPSLGGSPSSPARRVQTGHYKIARPGEPFHGNYVYSLDLARSAVISLQCERLGDGVLIQIDPESSTDLVNGLIDRSLTDLRGEGMDLKGEGLARARFAACIFTPHAHCQPALDSRYILSRRYGIEATMNDALHDQDEGVLILSADSRHVTVCAATPHALATLLHAQTAHPHSSDPGSDTLAPLAHEQAQAIRPIRVPVIMRAPPRAARTAHSASVHRFPLIRYGDHPDAIWHCSDLIDNPVAALAQWLGVTQNDIDSSHRVHVNKTDGLAVPAAACGRYLYSTDVHRSTFVALSHAASATATLFGLDIFDEPLLSESIDVALARMGMSETSQLDDPHAWVVSGWRAPPRLHESATQALGRAFRVVPVAMQADNLATASSCIVLDACRDRLIFFRLDNAARCALNSRGACPNPDGHADFPDADSRSGR